MVMLFRSLLYAVVFTLLLTNAIAFAQSKQLMSVTMENILEEAPSQVASIGWLNDDFALVEYRSDGSENRIVAVSISGLNEHYLASGTLPSASQQGNRLVYFSEGAWVLSSVTGPPHQVKEVARLKIDKGGGPVGPAIWSDDGDYILFTYVDSLNPFLHEPTIETRNGVRIEDVGASNSKRELTSTSLVVASISEDGEATILNSVKVEGYSPSCEFGPGDSIYCSRFKLQDYAEYPTTDIIRWNFHGPSMSAIYQTEGRMVTAAARLSPSANWIALAIDADSRLWSDFVSLIIVCVETGEERRITRSKRIAWDYEWGKDDDTLYFTARQGAFDYLFSSDIAGNVVEVLGDETRYLDLQRSPSGHSMLFQTEDAFGTKTIEVLDTIADQRKPLVMLERPADSYQLGSFEQIQWKSKDGLKLSGALFFPEGFDPNDSYPLIVFLHGGGPGSKLSLYGPLSSSIRRSPLEWHAWAQLGYVVFLPDFRSSGTYGPEPVVERYNRGDFFGIEGDLIDIQSGVDAVLSRGFVQKEQVFLLGNSAGASRANALLTIDHSFAAAALNEMVPVGALGNLITFTTGPFTGLPFEETLFEWNLGGKLRDVPERYLSGYLFSGHAITTPTLILLGGRKTREAWAAEAISSEALFTQLVEYDVPSKMLRFVDEGHGYTDPNAVLIAFEEIENWFHSHSE